MAGREPVDPAVAAFDAVRAQLAALTAKVEAMASQAAARPDINSTLRQIVGMAASLSGQITDAEARLKPTPINVQAIADQMAAQAARSAAAATHQALAAELAGFRGLVRRVEDLLRREVGVLRMRLSERVGLVVMSGLLGWTLSFTAA